MVASMTNAEFNRMNENEETDKGRDERESK